MGRKRLADPGLTSPSLEESVAVSFFVEKAIAEQLARFPNKSAFIRRAIMSTWSTICPLCHCTGIVPRGLAVHYADLIANATIYCDYPDCHALMVLPHTLLEIPPPDQPRVGQFLNGGELFCDQHYDMVPTCSECGWKVTVKGMAEHIRMIHQS
jgi:hypothetical protein